MRKLTFLLTVAATLLATDLADAQRRAGRGGRNARQAWRRPEEISDRLAVYFKETEGPKTDGEKKVADLDTIDLVRAAASANQVTVLYLHDGELDERAVRDFETMLFRADAKGDSLGIKLRLFHCGQIDISKDPALKHRYGKKTPMFVAFDKAGKELKGVSMTGLKPNPGALEGLLDRASKGAFKPTLTSFAKKYTKLVQDLEVVLKEKTEAEQDQAKAGNDKAKQSKARKEIETAAKAEQKLLEKEQEMLADMRFPARGNKKLGGRVPSRRNNTAGNTGKGNTGKGNTGRGNTGRGRTGGK